MFLVCQCLYVCGLCVGVRGWSREWELGPVAELHSRQYKLSTCMCQPWFWAFFFLILFSVLSFLHTLSYLSLITTQWYDIYLLPIYGWRNKFRKTSIFLKVAQSRGLSPKPEDWPASVYLAPSALPWSILLDGPREYDKRCLPSPSSALWEVFSLRTP